MVLYVDSGFQNMFLWKRFGALASTTIEYSATAPSRTGVVSTIGTKNIYRAHLLRWVGVKQSSGELLAVVIDKEENLIFSCTPLSLWGFTRSKSLRRLVLRWF